MLSMINCLRLYILRLSMSSVSPSRRPSNSLLSSWLSSAAWFHRPASLVAWSSRRWWIFGLHGRGSRCLGPSVESAPGTPRPATARYRSGRWWVVRVVDPDRQLDVRVGGFAPVDSAGRVELVPSSRLRASTPSRPYPHRRSSRAARGSGDWLVGCTVVPGWRRPPEWGLSPPGPWSACPFHRVSTELGQWVFSMSIFSASFSARSVG